MLRAVKDSFVKLAPKTQLRNPVMFLVYVSAVLTTALYVCSLFGVADARPGFILAVAVILWFTVLFADFAEAIAEGRGKAQADALRAARQDVTANKIPSPDRRDEITRVKSACLRKGDLVLVGVGEQIPADGEVIDGAASVDESAITRRIRAGHPRIGRRPQRGHRRHDRPFGLAGRAGHQRGG